jgi:hypothetical protein
MVTMLPSTLSVMQIPEAALFMPQFHGCGVKLRG